MYLQLMILSAGAASLLVFLFWKLFKILLRPYTTPLRDLPGPPRTSWFLGNFREIWNAENSVMHETWAEQYGPTFKYKGLFNIDRLMTLDTRAMHHILSRGDVYQKPDQARRNLARTLGKGLLVVEDEEHRKQRKIMNPAFGPAYIRDLTDIFLEKSIQLRDVWTAILSKSETAEHTTQAIDALSWLSKLTLDIIGLAGFDYHFGNLNIDQKPSELSQAFAVMFEATTNFNILPVLASFVPMLNLIPTKQSIASRNARATMQKIGRELLSQKKAAFLTESSGEKIGKDTVKSRDLLSLLVRANMAIDLPERQRLSDEDVLAQVPTFLTAGHETTSTGTVWCLYALCLDPRVQTKLREELLTVSTDMPSMDKLSSLPYLDAVCRETLRVHAPVPSTIRVAVKDDVIPLSTPVVDRHGRTRESIRISKGDPVFIPILAINRNKDVWGKDAHEFKPERWESPPEAISSIPGVWGNMLSFLGGTHACIGYRFSVIEMKAILFTLIRAFEFELAVPKEDIIKKSVVVQRPVVLSDPKKRNQMPLRVRLYCRD